MEADALGECEVRRVQDKGGPGTTFLPLFTRHQPFHLHDWGEGAQPSETLGVPMLLPSVRRGKAASLFPVGPGCLQSPQSPQNAKCRAPLELCNHRHCWVLGLCILPPAGVGSAPQVRITGPEEDGVRVVCTASGWFPKPQVQWRDLSGEKFLAFSEAHTQDAEGLFSVEAALVVRDSSVGNVTCSILNPVLGQEEAMAIFIPGQRGSRLPARLEEGAGYSWVFRAGLSWVGALTGYLAGLQSPSSPRPLPGRWLSR